MDAPDPNQVELLERYLAERDEPCPRCGYNLRGLTRGRCPECGDELRLQVGLVEPRLGPYLALLVACCLGVGGAGLFSLIALTAAPLGWWREPSGICTIALFLAAAIGLWITLRGRQRIRRKDTRRQVILAGIAWLIVASFATAIVLLFED